MSVKKWKVLIKDVPKNKKKLLEILEKVSDKATCTAETPKQIKELKNLLRLLLIEIEARNLP